MIQDITQLQDVFYPETILRAKRRKKVCYDIKYLPDDQAIKVLTHPEFKYSMNMIKAAFITKIPLIWEFPDQAVLILEALSELSYDTCSNFISKSNPVEIPSRVLENLAPEVISGLIEQQKDRHLLYIMNYDVVKPKLASKIIVDPEFAAVFSQIIREQNLRLDPLSIVNLLSKLVSEIDNRKWKVKEIVKWVLSSQTLNNDEKAIITEVLLELWARPYLYYSKKAVELEEDYIVEKEVIIKFVQEMVSL
ncbi:MAG: hypothetical protein ACPLSA_08755 [Caldanaerobacter sp.]